MEFHPVLIEGRRQPMKAAGLWPDLTLNDLVAACLAARPDSRALTAVDTATRARKDLTFRELNELAGRAAAGLSRLGVGRNDVVACQLPNGWRYVVTALACARIGAVFNPLMPIFRERELGFMLKHAEARVFIAPHIHNGFDHAAMAERLRPSLPALEHVIIAAGGDGRDFDALLLQEAADAAPPIAVSPDDVCQLLYTSGTTGEPKGVMHTANTLMSNVLPYRARLGLTSADVVLMASPMAHQTGYLYGLLLPLSLGARLVVMDRWEPRLAASLIAQEGCSFTMASTPFLIDLTQAAEEGADCSALRLFVCAGASIPAPVVERARKALGAKIVSAWGMTENGAVTLTAPDDPDERAATTDGFPLPGVEIQIRDRNGSVAGAGVAGELYVRACSNFAGYLKRPDLNDMDAEGWFATGDVARVDREGYVRICGRAKDIIIRGAENIPVAEVEAALFRHPAIASVAIVGYPDPRLGERACAFVTLRPGAEFSFATMIAFLESQRMAKQYFPERLEICAALPMTASGKVQKFALREQLAREARS